MRDVSIARSGARLGCNLYHETFNSSASAGASVPYDLKAAACL